MPLGAKSFGWQGQGVKLLLPSISMWKCGAEMTSNVVRQLNKGFKLLLQLVTLVLTALLAEVTGPSKKKKALQSNHLICSGTQHYKVYVRSEYI